MYSFIYIALTGRRHRRRDGPQHLENNLAGSPPPHTAYHSTHTG